MKEEPSPIILNELIDSLEFKFNNFSEIKKEYYTHLLFELTYLAINKGELKNLSGRLLNAIFAMIINNFFQSSRLLILRIIYKISLCPTLTMQTLLNILNQIKTPEDEEIYKSAIISKFLAYNTKMLAESQVKEAERIIFDVFDNQEEFLKLIKFKKYNLANFF